MVSFPNNDVIIKILNAAIFPSFLQDIENSHHTLLKTLREPLVNQESEDQQCPSATVSRTPSLDRGSGDGEKQP